MRCESRAPVILESSRLARPEIVPTPLSERSLGPLAFLALWFTMAAQMGVFQLGASLAEALPIPVALLAVLVGNVAMVIILVLIADIGVEHGVNFAGYLRAPFGLTGSYLPLVLRALAAIAWFGIQTYLGATAIDLIAAQFLGVDLLPLWYVLFGLVEIAIVAGGLGVIRWVINVAAPALFVLSLWLLYLMLSRTSPAAFFAHPVTAPQPFVVGVVANMSYWATVAINLPDFTRHVRVTPSPRFVARNHVSVVAQTLGVPLGMLFFTLVGMAGLVTTGQYNPVLAIARVVGGPALLLGLAIVVLAQLSTNVTANLYASAYAANAIGSPRVSYAGGAVITGLLGLLTLPWVLLEFFLTYLPLLGAILAPIAGIMLADYYLIRHRRLAVPRLFDPGGEYHYWHGLNPASYLAWAAGAILGVILLDWSFLVALPVALVLYAVLMRAWILPRYPQSEVQGGDERFLATSHGCSWPVRMAEPREPSTAGGDNPAR